MKMKLLDYTLIGLLAGVSPLAIAQQAPASLGMAQQAASDLVLPAGRRVPIEASASAESMEAVAPASTATPAEIQTAKTNVDCTGDTCTSAEGLLMRVRTRGEREPLSEGTTEQSSAQALQADRRVNVETEQPGKVVAVGKWSINVPGGGVIWVTEDPSLGQPQLNVSASSLVAFDGTRITKPIRFFVRNNYSAFIQRAEVVVYRATDADLTTPIATIELPAGGVSEVEWQGALPDGLKLRTGDELQYIVRAFDANGNGDETFPRRMQLVRPEDAARGAQRLRDSMEQQDGMSFSVEDAERQSLINDVFTGDALRQQNIPIYGSRIRLQGRNLPNRAITINGQPYPIDLEGKLAAEYLVPVGKHQFVIGMPGPDGSTVPAQTLDVDVTGRYMFAVAIADLTASRGDVSGSIEPLAADDRFDDDFLLEGRLGFYIKGKIRGKYLVTAQADTREREVTDLFDGFWDADPQDIFRRLDPDAYYPVYGDDSTTYRDVDTQGRLYVRVDWDKSQAMWGNFETGVTGTEFGQYSRALYGAALGWRSQDSTALGEATSTVRAFGSEAQTVPGHTEFLGTGGSLYYLKHTDVLPGSDRVIMEVRDATTGRVEEQVTLLRGADYEIDEMQGRILLTRPLSQVTRENVSTITRDTPLDGFAQVLLVDYEYVPNGFDPDEITAGFRGKHWFGDHLALGATHVDESRAGEDYTLTGADVTLQAGRGTYLKIEHAETEATSAPVFFSDNGGLSFTELNSGLSAREGDAESVEARVNFKELGWTNAEWSAAAWWRQVDAGFSVARFDQGFGVEEQGAELLGWVTENFKIYTRYSNAERGVAEFNQAQLTGEWRIGEANTLSGEFRRVEESGAFSDIEGTLAAIRYLHRIGSAWEVYGTAQVTVDDDDGRYADNDALTVGVKHLFGALSSVGAEVTSGDRGNAAQINADYRLSPEHTFYGAYTYSTDTTAYDPLFDSYAFSNRRSPGWTFGQRWRLSNQVNLFNESQFLKAPNESGLAHTYGMNFYPGAGWNAGFTLQTAELDRAIGQVDRQAISVNGGRTSVDTQWQSKLEWREDSGFERREQWVTTNRFLHRFNDSFRIAARLNYSKTEDELVANAGARFVESNVGFAWRPWDTTRWSLLGKYTYLYDVSSLEQIGDKLAFYDQRSQVLSFDGIYNPSNAWEFAGKLARREGEVRFGRLEGQWADSSTTFAAGQVRYEFGDAWHSLAEYRWLGVDDGGDRQGFLVGIDRDIGQYFRAGFGYNFTDFSDDLTDFDYDHQGVFFNLVGRY